MVQQATSPASPVLIPARLSSAGFGSPKRSKGMSNGHTASSPPTVSRQHLQSANGMHGALPRRSNKHRSQPLSHPDPTTIGADLTYQRKPQWSEEKESVLLGPYDYLIGHPGKDIRSLLISAFDTWLQVPKASLDIITGVVGMLHTASLLVDDVEDSSNLRRGFPVAHAIFGTAQTINSANYVYFLALKELGRLNNPNAIAVFAEEMVNLHRGQGMDLWWRDSLTCPSEDDYLEMVSNKTGGLFRLAVKLMQTESSNPAFVLTSAPTSGASSPGLSQPSSDARKYPQSTGLTNPLIPLVNTIGLLYQILDDYQNLASTTYTANKGLAEDLTEGKFSFLIAHAIRSDPSDQTLPSILQQRTKDDDVKRFAVKFIESTGSFEYTRKVLRTLDARAMKLLDEVDAWNEQDGLAQAAGTDERPGDGVRSILERLRVSEPTVLNGSTNGNGNGTSNPDSS